MVNSHSPRTVKTYVKTRNFVFFILYKIRIQHFMFTIYKYFTF